MLLFLLQPFFIHKFITTNITYKTTIYMHCKRKNDTKFTSRSNSRPDKNCACRVILRMRRVSLADRGDMDNLEWTEFWGPIYKISHDLS